MSDRETGLVGKYYAVRADGDPTGKHADCAYFVLDPKHDVFARSAIREYSRVARLDGYVALADDLDAWLTDIAKAEQ